MLDHIWIPKATKLRSAQISTDQLRSTQISSDQLRLAYLLIIWDKHIIQVGFAQTAAVH